MTVIEEGRLKGAFKGYHNRDTVFEFQGGGRWQQNEYRYQYHYAYMPEARVVDDGGKVQLYVAGMDAPIEVKRMR